MLSFRLEPVLAFFVIAHLPPFDQLTCHRRVCACEHFSPRAGNCFIENSANQKSEQFCSRPLKARAITAPTNPTPIPPRRRYLVPPAVAENHQGGSNFRFSTSDFDCAGRGALTSEGPHRIDHAHGYGSNFYRSEHRHSNCPRSRCLSLALATYYLLCEAHPNQNCSGSSHDG